jgi:hypothetical protein
MGRTFLEEILKLDERCALKEEVYALWMGNTIFL